jgi:hypothetical protein
MKTVLAVFKKTWMMCLGAPVRKFYFLSQNVDIRRPRPVGGRGRRDLLRRPHTNCVKTRTKTWDTRDKSWCQHHDSDRCAAVFINSFVSTVFLSMSQTSCLDCYMSWRPSNLWALARHTCIDIQTYIHTCRRMRRQREYSEEKASYSGMLKKYKSPKISAQTSYNLFKVNRRFGETFRLGLRGKKKLLPCSNITISWDY